MTDHVDRIFAGTIWLCAGLVIGIIAADAAEASGVLESAPYVVLGIALVPVFVAGVWVLGTIAIRSKEVLRL